MRRRRWLVLGVLAVGAAVVLGACSPLYVLRAGYEEAKILWRREPMERILARPNLEPDTREKLETVVAARQYAEGLGLAVRGSFGSVSRLDREHNIYVVTAAKRTALEPYTWWFPVVGQVPYKGFFNRARADAEVALLAAEGYDTYVRGAAAFSTLGWFDDPLLEHLLRRDEVFLVNLILHEVYHNTYFVPGQSDFNESIANFVGHRGAIEFFRSTDDVEALRRAERDWEDELRFAGFLERMTGRLKTRYAAAKTVEEALQARDEEIAAARQELATLELPRARVKSFLAEPLNNAVLIQYRLYTTELALFDAIYHQTGSLRGALDFIQAAADEKRGTPFAAVQSAFVAEQAARSQHQHAPAS